MSKLKIFVLMIVLFSSIGGTLLSAMPVLSETTTTIIDDKNLNLSYELEKKGDEQTLQLSFRHQSEQKEIQQRLKLRITDKDECPIEYPKVDKMLEKEEWLIEKEFSVSRQSEVAVKLPKSIKTVNLYVQMDQRNASNELADSAAEIEEDILEEDAPYVIELGNEPEKEAQNSTEEIEMKPSSAESKKKTTVTSEAFIGPKKEATRQFASGVTPMNSGTRMFAPIYENFKPTYTLDGPDGSYPTNAWQPEEQSNVRNHQGGEAKQKAWDGNSTWNVAGDNHTNSYIKYGDDPANPNLAIRKYAQQTAKKDEFKIKLNVRGNTIFKPGVDIVFLLDNTGSMSTARKTQATTAINSIVAALKKEATPSSNGIRLGAHIYASYHKQLEEVEWGWTRARTHHKLSSNPTDWEKIGPAYSSLPAVGGTFTQRGLQEASDILNDPATDLGEERYKLIFLLTDGAPNLSWKPLTAEANNLIYYDPTLVTSFDSGIKPNYKEGSALGDSGVNTKFKNSVYVNSRKISSHLTTTNSTAYKLKDEGIEIHSIAVLISSPGSPEHSALELQKGLYKMASKKANASGDNKEDFFYYQATNTTELNKYFTNWYQTIIRTAEHGEITDPMGDMVDLIDTPKWRQVDNTGKTIRTEDEPSISTVSGDRKVVVNDINLTGNQEIEIEYTVRLKPEAVSGRWYPTNKMTTLEPTPERTTDKLEFGSPSVRIQREDFTIPVEKIWTDKNDLWGKRPNSVTVKLQKYAGTTWTDVQTKELTGPSWKAIFDPVEGGEMNRYRVIEPNRTAGYKAATVNQKEFSPPDMVNGGIKITNELLQGNYQFFKYQGEEGQVFKNDLPRFTVKRKNDHKVLAQDLTPDPVTGRVEVSGLTIGDFIVEETYVPKGFKKIDDFEIKVTENSSASALVAKVNNNSADYKAINELNDFSLVVEKVDQRKEALSGAEFRLTGPNYDETKASGATFDFQHLRPGDYRLEETKSPAGYEKIAEPILFTITKQGKVEITDHPNVIYQAGGISDTDNRIQLRVQNQIKKEGTLPRTGDKGIKVFFAIAAGLSLVGMMIGGFFLYKIRKGRY